MSKVPKVKPGGVGFWSGNDGQLHGAVVTKFAAYRLFWESKYYPICNECKIWERKKYDDHIDPGEVIHTFLCDNPKTAAAIAQKWTDVYIKKLNESRKSLAEKAKPLVVQPKIEAAWMEANKTFWPNLHKATCEGTDIETALKIDLSAMGFSEPLAITEEIAKAFLRTKISDPDKLNLWLVSNWSCGKNLAHKQPSERLTLVEKAGFTVTKEMLGMRLNRLGLTSRKLRQ
jgi:hypothetical protein